MAIKLKDVGLNFLDTKFEVMGPYFTIFVKITFCFTGYVLISHVDVTRIVLPSLQIIRGQTLFKMSVHEVEFSLMVTLSKMHNLELPALRGKLEIKFPK